MHTVVAALIGRDSKLLICQRKRGGSRGLQWEFPGGKVEPGESAPEALARELREELNVAAVVGEEVYRTNYRYSDLPDELQLIFLRAQIGAGVSPENLVFERVEWTDPASLKQYNFLAADRELIDLLASGSIAAEAAK